MSNTTDHAQQAADVALGAAVISHPLWLDTLTNGLSVYIMIGGAILMTLRIVMAVRDWKKTHAS
jgi:hypothetical protein